MAKPDRERPRMRVLRWLITSDTLNRVEATLGRVFGPFMRWIVGPVATLWPLLLAVASLANGSVVSAVLLLLPAVGAGAITLWGPWGWRNRDRAF